MHRIIEESLRDHILIYVSIGQTDYPFIGQYDFFVFLASSIQKFPYKIRRIFKFLDSYIWNYSDFSSLIKFLKKRIRPNLKLFIKTAPITEVSI